MNLPGTSKVPGKFSTRKDYIIVILYSIDIAIILPYVLFVVLAGILLSRRASQNLDSYFLGGKSVPWYILGVSNASSMFCTFAGFCS